MKRRLAVLVVATAMAFGSMVGIAAANHGAHCDNGVGNGPDCRPGRATFSNDDHGGTTGNPGALGGGAGGTEYTTRDKGNNEIVG